MENEKIKKIYYKATGVNLDEQLRIWDERGKGYYGEFLVFEELFENISGYCKILLNLELPAQSGKTTEVDLLLIHETGIYVFEVKHHKGIIYGQPSDKTWTQYFRSDDSNVFKNPLLQNDYHIKAIKRLMPDIPVHSFVVFTSDDCDLRIKVSGDSAPPFDYDAHVCALYRLLGVVNRVFDDYKQVLDIDEIESIFQRLKQYSHMTPKLIFKDDDTPVPFYEYLDSVKEECGRMVAKTEEKCNAKLEEIEVQKRNNSRKHIKATLIALATCLLISFIGCGVYKANCEKNCQTAIAQAERQCDEAVRRIENECNNEIDRIERECVIDIENIQDDANKKIGSAQASVEQMSTELDEMRTELEKMRKEYENMNSRFERVDLSDPNNYLLTDGAIKVETVLTMQTDLVNTAKLTCTLTNTAKEYGIFLNADTVFIIQMADGTVRECEMFGKRLTYYKYDNTLYPSRVGKLKALEIPDIQSVDQIEYIKITNISLYNSDKGSSKPVAVGLELTLYTKQ